MDLVELIRQSRLEQWNYIYTLWQKELFGFRWWVIFTLVVVAYAVWWKLIDKRQLSHLLFFGSLISVLRIIFDDAVVGMGLYTYQTRLVPLSHAIFLNDLTLIPLVYMLIHQYSASWRSFLLLSALWSGLWAFVAFPLLKIVGVVVVHEWKLYYSFISILLIGVFTRFVVFLVMRVEQGDSVQRSVATEIKAMAQPVMKPLHNILQDEDE